MSGNFSSSVLHSASKSSPIATLRVTINVIKGTVCADRAATHSTAGETLNQILKKHGVIFSPSSFMMILANGSKTKGEIQTTRVKIRLGSRTLPLNLVSIPEAKGNNTLLVIDFLESSGIVLKLKQKTWFFSDLLRRQFHFVEQIQESFPCFDALDSNASQMATSLLK